MNFHPIYSVIVLDSSKLHIFLAADPGSDSVSPPDVPSVATRCKLGNPSETTNERNVNLICHSESCARVTLQPVQTNENHLSEFRVIFQPFRYATGNNLLCCKRFAAISISAATDLIINQ